MKELTMSESKKITGGVHFPTSIEQGGIGLAEYPSVNEVIENFESFSNAFIAYACFRTIGVACVLEAKIKQLFED